MYQEVIIDGAFDVNNFICGFLTCLLIVLFILGVILIKEEPETACEKQYKIYVEYMDMVNLKLFENGFGARSVYTEQEYCFEWGNIMDQLEIIKDWLITDQQMTCYDLYQDHVYDFGRHPSKKDFIEFYKMWCYNKKHKNDFTENQIN